MAKSVIYLCTMVKLRRNHKQAGSFGVRILILVVGGAVALTWLITQTADLQLEKTDPVNIERLVISEDPRWYLPTSTTDDVIHHDYYSLSYAEEHEQAEWVAYRLTKASLVVPNVPRTDWFEEDLEVPSGSAHYKDYSGSGYTRGHLVPAGDMAFNEEAMEATFLMSNVSPQLRAFNNGIWKELEQQVRDWAFQYDSLFVISGPVFNDPPWHRIGKNQVTVPEAFFKIILTFTEDGPIAAGFVIPNEMSEQRLEKYMVSIDSIESVTQIDFFSDILDEAQEEQIESSVMGNRWSFNEGRFITRVQKWNRE